MPDQLRGKASWGTGMSPAARIHRSRPKTKAPDSKKGKPLKWRAKRPSELRKAAEQAASRAEALQVLFRPLQEAGEAELQKTKSGRKLLEEVQTFSKELGQLQERFVSGDIRFEEGRQLVRERSKAFRDRYGDPLAAALAPHVHLQPSVEAVARVLSPQMASRTVWVSETSFLRAMLLQPKRTAEDVGTVQQGLGDPPPPPMVQSCVTPTYGLSQVGADGTPASGPVEGGIGEGFAPGAEASKTTGNIYITGETWAVLFSPYPVEVRKATAFVGQDFQVPAGPIKYEVTITYDWWAYGNAGVFFGAVAIVSVDLAISIAEGNYRETHAREITLFSVPVLGWDSFSHSSPNAKITIPFNRADLRSLQAGTVRIMVGADGHCTTIGHGLGSHASFTVRAKIREICVTSTG